MDSVKTFIKKIIKFDSYSLKFNTIRSALWSVAGKGGGNIIRISGNLILTRILFPEAFGMMAIANVVLLMIVQFADTGMSVAIIQNPRGEEKEFLDTSWIISIFRGIFLWILISVMAWPAAEFYNEPHLKNILLILAFNPFFLGFSNPALPLLIKKFRVEKQVMLEISTQIFALFITILLALILKSVFALAIGHASSSILKLFASYIIISYRPSFKWNKTAGLELINFGKFIILNTIVTVLINNMGVLMIGKILGMEDVSYFNIGKNLGGLLAIFCVQMLSQSYMPAVSSVQSDFIRVQSIYRRTITFLIAVMVPLSMVISLFAYDFIRLLYDPRYQLSYISMYWIGLAGIFRTISSVTGVTFFSLGKPVYETLSKLIAFLLLIVFLPYSIKINNLIGGTICVAAIFSVIAIAECIFLKYKLKFSTKIILNAWIQSIVTSSLCYAVFYILRFYLQNEQLYNIPFAIVCGILFVVISASIHWYIEGTNPFRQKFTVSTDP